MKQKYIDEFKNIHYIDRELGRGGQGIVYTTKDADTVIKLALKNEQTITDKNEIKIFHQKVKRLIFKPLSQDINIAKPLSLLENEAGYVMHLLEGMIPFSTLLPQELPKERAENIKIPNFLQDIYEKDKRVAIYFSYYLYSGGLRKRLYTLSRLAIVLYRLHTRGIVYFDVSHNNVFINRDDIPLVYLIDADNIEYESINKSTVHTPNFEVPEVAKGEPNSTYSDIYAFGILAFLTLTTTHPFDGVGLKGSDWDSEEGEKKEKWELPWIEDKNDDSNKSKSSGLRVNLTITHELNTIFQKLFEEGREDKFKRPTLPIWIESFEKAANDTIICNSCDMSYYDSYFDACPYCDTQKSKRLIVQSYLHKDGQKQTQKWKFVKEIDSKTKSIRLPKYIFTSLNFLTIDDSFLEIVFSKKTRVELYFEKSDEEIFFESSTPMRVFRKRIGLERLENGITIIVKSDIETFTEIKLQS